MTQAVISVHVDPDEIDQLIDVLAPIAGGIWLATDLRTHIHWTILAAGIAPVLESPEDRFCRASGLATIRASDGTPVFLLNERDTIEWIEPGRILAVRELGDVTCEIRLERLDDLDARLIDAFRLQCLANEVPTLRTLSVGHGRYLQIYDDQLPTGNLEVDAILRTIEATVEARRKLFGPSAGTLDVMDQLEHDLSRTLQNHQIHSYIWPAVLLEQIAGMRLLLAA